MGWEEEVARLLRLQRMHRKMARQERMEAGAPGVHQARGEVTIGKETGEREAGELAPPPFSFREVFGTPVAEAPPEERYHALQQEMEAEGVFAAQDAQDEEAQGRRHQHAWEEAERWPTLYGVFEQCTRV